MLDIATYLNRITSQHKVKPKYMALVAARLQPFIDLAECLESFDAAFDLDLAVGRQLDVIGEYVGVSRLLNFQPQFSPAMLPDPYYRMLIKAKISLNNWDGTVDGIERLWGDVFPNYVITVIDNQDMTLNVQISGLQSLFESELIQHGYITPKPMGVLVDPYVLFTITLDTTLYLGAIAHDRFLVKGLPAPAPPTGNSKPPGDVFVEGMAIDNRVRRTTADKPPPTGISVGGIELYVAGLKNTDRKESNAADKPPPLDVTVDDARIFAVGLVTESIIESVTQNRPPSADIAPPLVDDYTHAGLLADKSAVSSIESKPNMGVFDTQRVMAYTGGTRVAVTLRHTLPGVTA